MSQAFINFALNRHVQLGFTSRLAMVDGDIRLSGRLSRWVNGWATPAKTARSIIGCAELLHSTADQIIALLWPDFIGLSPEQIQAKAKQDAAKKCLAKFKERYQIDAELRKKVSVKKIKPPEKKTPRRLRWEQFNQLTPEQKVEALKVSATQSKHRRRARLCNAKGSHSRVDFWTIAKAWDYCCAYCQVRRSKDVSLTADHMIPLASQGSNGPENIVPACFSCNSSKQNRELISWARSKGFTLSDRLLVQYLSLGESLAS